MRKISNTTALGYDRRLLFAIAIIIALLVSFFTWAGIQTSHRDSLKLLVMQGKAFAEALALAAENTIASESFADYLVHRRYSEIVTFLSDLPLDNKINARLTQTALRHNLYGIYICDLKGNILAQGTGRTDRTSLPDFVITELKSLTANPEENYVLLLEDGQNPGLTTHYYIEIANTLDRVFVIADDASYYTEAMRRTQIGYMVRNMAREAGVEYIIYQSTEGIIFSSRKTGQLLAIESDPFLSAALDSDSITQRQYDFQGRRVLELVRPFATDEYPFGLFRVGLSLDGYYAVSRAFDRQMVLLAAALFGVLLLGLLYINSRHKRRQIVQRYTEIKSITDTIFDQMRTGVAVIDKDGVITLTNRAFENILGLRNILNRLWDELNVIPSVTVAELVRWKDNPEERELNITVNEKEKTVLFTVSEFKSGLETPSGLVVVVYDITRLKEFERTSARRERLSEMGNLAAGVAHEIRNPLNAISIAAQRLGTEYVPDDSKEEFITLTNHIRTETKRLNKIITRFLELAREEKKKQTEIDLSSFLEELNRFLQVEAESSKIDLKVETEPGLKLEADPDKLKQMFTNLFNNSKEALDDKPGKVSITAKRHNNTIVINFSDDGQGIKEELREKVFTPYFTTKEAGTGLGLPTIHKIISDLGGTIHVEESEFGGACFVIIIPTG